MGKVRAAPTWAGLTVAASPAKLNAGASSGAVTAMNWAAWEYRVGVQRRKDIWRLEVTIKPGTKRHIWSSEDALRAERTRDSFKYGGAMTGRMTATQVAMLQQQRNSQYSHMMDAMNYALMGPLMKRMAKLVKSQIVGNHDYYSPGVTLEKVWFDEWAIVDRPRIEHEFKQRTGEITWPRGVQRVRLDRLHQHHDFVRSLNDTSSSEPARSRPATNWRGRGKPSRTRRRFIT